MNPNPRVIDRAALAVTALQIMEERKITSLLVASADGRIEGVLHLHDLWQMQMF
jgi:arabinose-5-phosphate isomerase